MTLNIPKLLVFTACLAPVILWAQSEASAKDSLPEQKIEDVLISSERLQLSLSQASRNMQVLTRQDWKNSPVQNLNEALGQIGGLDLRTRGPQGVQADLSLMGGGFDQTLVLLNGIKMNDPQTGHHALNLPVDLGSLERIEVVKGSASRLYGPGAFAGAVNVVTRVSDENKGFVNLMGGGYGLLNVSAGATFGVKKMRNLFSASLGRSQGYQPASDFAMYNAYYQTDAQVFGGKAKLMAGYNSRNFGANTFYSSNFKNQYEETRTGFIAAEFQKTIGALLLTARGYWRRHDDMFLLKRENPSFYKNTHRTDVFGAELHAAYASKLGRTALGIDYRSEGINSSNLGVRDRENIGFFLEHKANFGRFIVTPGVYGNYFSNGGFQAFPGLDLGYQIKGELYAFVSGGRSFRLPTYTDLYYRDPSNLGNPNLRPESAWTGEAGLRQVSQTLRATLAYFYRQGTDMIDYTRLDASTPWQVQNFNSVTTQGVDANVQWSPSSSPFKVSGNYTFLSSDVDAGAQQSKYVLGHLRHQANVGIEYTFAKVLTPSIWYRYGDRLNGDTYRFLDARLSYSLRQQINFYLEASNILNEQFRTVGTVALPGIWVRGGARFEFGL